ncbi:XdhC family protein [Jannaschia sp. Os4]|uniref:XdhC family protein n=1 Tax=Jannaschia sp. Os4 TaxID=2807617 RepID=UPI00193927D1|nr:XdhC family protein [Jannaschia sp. Os4]MBM2578122.1 XdhC family protein [Jannaschia sp. Os4]
MPVALVTLIAVVGSAYRAPGALMLVHDDGTWMGQITGGCLEAAVALEARKAMAAGAARTLRYGAGSPFMDIRLPCGGGVVLHVDPCLDPDVMIAACTLQRARRAFAFAFDPAAPDPNRDLVAPDAFVPPGRFAHRVAPRTRVLVAGRGAELFGMVRLAVAAGHEVVALSPDPDERAACAEAEARVHAWTAPDRLPSLPPDRWTALASLLHDSDWEGPLLEWALPSPAFHVSAIGGHRTREARAVWLSRRLAPRLLARLRAPAGLVPSCRDPRSLAASILAQIVADGAAAQADLSDGPLGGRSALAAE